MEEEIFNYEIDIMFEYELTQDIEQFKNGFMERYKVLNSNIILTEKIKNLAKNNNSTANITIWNIYGFLNIVQYDLTSVGYNLILENKRWQKIYYARQVVLIMYEAFEDIPKMLGKEYKELFNGITEAQAYLDTLNDYKKEFFNMKKIHIEFLKNIRMNVSAHREQDIDQQLQVMRGINPYEIIKIMFNFEKIIRNIVTHIEKYLVHSISLQESV